MAEDADGNVMVCHYEVMQLEFNCKTEEIKKQYKVLALKYHPDRNHGDEENATRKFKQLSAAYAVLSDPHERTWYDDHRDAILRGGNGVAGEDDDEPHTVNVWKYFNASCYTGTSDESPTGFYNVYRTCFEEILKSENDKTKTESASAKALSSIPFGNSATPISTVLSFYNEWENFTSRLNFAWADIYHSVDAPNRATRRVMEKDNQKARDAAKKEFTNQIRSLAKFVKKRDPRFLAYENEIKARKAEEDEKKRLQKVEELTARKDRRERAQLEHENDTEWLEARDNERKAAFLLADNEDEDEDNIKMSGGLGGGGGESDDEMQLQNKLRNASLKDAAGAAEDPAADGSAEETYCCALCEKEFKTEIQLTQHNASKVHRQKVKDQAKAQKKGGGKDKAPKEPASA